MKKTQLLPPATLLDETQARKVAQLAMDAVNAPDVAVSLRSRSSGNVRFANNGVTTAGIIHGGGARIAVGVGKKRAVVDTDVLSPDAIVAAARRAHDIATRLPDNPEYMPDLGAASFAPVPAAWSRRTALLTVEERAQQVAAAIAEFKQGGKQGAGFLETSAQSSAHVTRAGFFGLHHETSCTLSTTARTPDGRGSGGAAQAGIDFSAIDARAAAAVAADLALRNHEPSALPPGDYTVVLEPSAVASLLNGLLEAIDLRDAEEGHSPFTKQGGPPGQTRIGERIFGDATVRVDPRLSLVPSAPYDNDGMVRRGINFIEDGVLRGLSASRYWAQKTGRAPMADYRTMQLTGPRVQTTAELIAGVERGLLVTRFYYLRTLDPQKLSVTGLTRDGVFLIENGKVTRAVNNFRFNQSVIDLLANADGYGAPVCALNDDNEMCAAPALRSHKFHMASVSNAI